MDTIASPSLPARRDSARIAPLDIAALLGPGQWARLSPAIQRRFAAAHSDTVYNGRLLVDCSAMGRCFAWLARALGAPLSARRDPSVPVTVRVYGDARGGVVWERNLRTDGARGEHIVRSTKLLGRHGLEERTDGGLSMCLDVVEEAGALVFYSRSYFLQIGLWRLPVPAVLTPGVCRVEHRDEGRGRFRFTLDMVHPWWGRTFYQTGLFSDPEESQS